MADKAEHVPELLLIPGPVSIDDEVLEVLGEPVWPHYGDAWTAVYLRTCANVGRVFKTESDVHLLFGPGMAGVEAAVTSLLGPGDQVLVPSNGFFGDRLAEVAHGAGMEVVGVETGPREPISADAVRAAMDAHPGLRAVCVVHHETSIGVLNPVREIAAMGRERGLLTIVDAVSSAGGVEFDMDGWGIDVAVTVANKALGGPVGVAPIAAGPRALAALDDGRPKAAGWYLNLATWRHATAEMRAWHPHPTTMPTNVIRALDLAVRRLLDEGLDERLRRLASARDTVRSGLREIGFEMMVPDEVASPVTTAVMGLPGMDVPGYMRWLLEEHGLRVGGAFGPFAGKMFRVGHMGRASDPEVIDRFLALTAAYVEGRR